MDIIKIILTSLLSIAVMFILAKFSGHKQIAQLDFYNYISGITIGSIAAELATELEKPSEPLTAMLVYGVVAVVLNKIELKNPRLRKYTSGTPTILMHNGNIYRDNLKQSKLDLSTFLMMCRQEGYFNLSDIQTAVFEYNGTISFLPSSGRRPATPDDMGIVIPQEHIFTEIIMDGRILGNNIKRCGFDLNWLKKRLQEQGFAAPSDIFLGLYNEDGSVVFYPNKNSADSKN